VELDSEPEEARNWKDVIPDGCLSPFDVAFEREQHVMIEAALEKLSPIFREAVVLRDITDMSYEEIADRPGCFPGDRKVPNPAGPRGLAGRTRREPERRAGPATGAEDGRVDCMSCENVARTDLFTPRRRLPEAERENLLAHTGVCRECGAHLASLQTRRAILRSMAQPAVPDALATRLSVLASHERERQLARVNIRERMRRLAAKLDLAFDNLMRPVALPLTGGILSTLLLFGLMMPSLSFSHQNGGSDFSTAPQGSIVATPWDQGADDDAADFPIVGAPDQPKSDYVNIVNLTIDESGRVADWSVVRGQITDEMKDIILFSHFEPATFFGVRTSGTVQVRQSSANMRIAAQRFRLAAWEGHDNFATAAVVQSARGLARAAL
jgi:hypothetical protein